MRSISHHDLRTGRVTTIPTVHDPLFKDELRRAIAASNETRGPVPIAGGRFQVTVDLSSVKGEASAFLYLSAGPALRSQAVPCGTILSEAIAVVWLATAPEAYRYFMARYLTSVSNAPPLSRWNAPSSMPVDTPYLCSFTTTAALVLTQSEKVQVSRLTWLIGLAVLEICEKSAAEMEAEGEAPMPDAARYPELRGYEES
jgi:hypothetical protein